MKQPHNPSSTAWQTQQWALAESGLVTAEFCAAIGQVSVSWWNRECKAGRAPAAAIQRPKFTRWRIAEVVAFWKNIQHSHQA